MADVQEQKQESQGEEQADAHNDQKETASRSGKKIESAAQENHSLRALALLVVAAIVAIPVYAYYSVRESTDDAQVDGHVIPISPRIAGTILEVLVNDNQPVKAGQELVKLDPADYQVALQQAQAQLSSSQANTSESQQNVPITTINTTSQISTSTTQVEQAQAGVAVGAAGRQCGAGTTELRDRRCGSKASELRQGAKRSGAHERSGREGRDFQAGLRCRRGGGGSKRGAGGFGEGRRCGGAA